jgi:hypothetical protein
VTNAVGMVMKAGVIESSLPRTTKQVLFGILKFVAGFTADTYSVASVLGKSRFIAKQTNRKLCSLSRPN